MPGGVDQVVTGHSSSLLCLCRHAIRPRFSLSVLSSLSHILTTWLATIYCRHQNGLIHPLYHWIKTSTHLLIAGWEKKSFPRKQQRRSLSLSKVGARSIKPLAYRGCLHDFQSPIFSELVCVYGCPKPTSDFVSAPSQRKISASPISLYSHMVMGFFHWECDRCEKAFKEHCNLSVTPFSAHHYLSLL